MALADAPFNLLRRPVARLRRVLVCAVVMVGTQARLESVRWWWSPPIVSALAITPQQSTAIERLYEESLPTRRRGSADVMGLTEDVVKRIRDGLYDDELLRVTGELAKAQAEQCDLRRHTFERAAQMLTPPQREKLTGLIAQKRIVE